MRSIYSRTVSSIECSSTRLSAAQRCCNTVDEAGGASNEMYPANASVIYLQLNCTYCRIYALAVFYPSDSSYYRKVLDEFATSFDESDYDRY